VIFEDCKLISDSMVSSMQQKIISLQNCGYFHVISVTWIYCFLYRMKIPKSNSIFWKPAFIETNVSNLDNNKRETEKNLNSNMNVSTLSILSEACNNILFHKKEVKEEKHTHTSWSWIYNFLCYQCLSPLRLWDPIQLRQCVLDTTLWDKVCQWLAKGRWFFPYTVSSIASLGKSEYIVLINRRQLHIHRNIEGCFAFNN
jgi:hypothetical protein